MRLKELEQSESDFERTLIDQVSELRGEFATLQQKISHKAKFMPFADELGRVQDEHAKFGADYAEFCEKYRAELGFLKNELPAQTIVMGYFPMPTSEKDFLPLTPEKIAREVHVQKKEHIILFK